MARKKKSVRLEELLQVLHKYNVTAYKGDGLEIVLAFNPSMPQQINVPEVYKDTTPRVKQPELPLSMQMWGANYDGTN